MRFNATYWRQYPARLDLYRFECCHAICRDGSACVHCRFRRGSIGQRHTVFVPQLWP